MLDGCNSRPQTLTWPLLCPLNVRRCTTANLSVTIGYPLGGNIAWMVINNRVPGVEQDVLKCPTVIFVRTPTILQVTEETSPRHVPTHALTPSGLRWYGIFVGTLCCWSILIPWCPLLDRPTFIWQHSTRPSHTGTTFVRCCFE